MRRLILWRKQEDRSAVLYELTKEEIDILEHGLERDEEGDPYQPGDPRACNLFPRGTLLEVIEESELFRDPYGFRFWLSLEMMDIKTALGRPRAH